jgi:hypothetical protein
MVSPIFHAGEVLGRHQIKGNARGPTEHRAMTMKVVRKYQGSASVARRGFWEASRNSPQCLHFTAASWISSAQKGQVFIFASLFSGSFIPPQTKSPRRKEIQQPAIEGGADLALQHLPQKLKTAQASQAQSGFLALFGQFSASIPPSELH